MPMQEFVKILLLPVARFCLRHGITLADCVDGIKSALLQASMEKLALRQEAVTASKLSIMSGLHRKDCAKFLKGIVPKRDLVSPAIKIIGAWQAKKSYLNSQGEPKRLTFGTETSEFTRLARETCADLHPSTILGELERRGLVKISKQGVIPIKSSFVFSFQDEDSAKSIARDIDQLILSAEENLQATRNRPNHHTTTEYDNIPSSYLSELREWILKEAGLFHAKIRNHVSKYDRDLSSKRLKIGDKETVRFTFGSFGRVHFLEKIE